MAKQETGMDDGAFYIGWQPKAPISFVQHVKKNLLILFAVALVISLLISSSQKKFSTSNFEYGKLTEVKGIYFSKPVPVLKVVAGKDIWGNISYITIPLVGYGKHGAETAIMQLEEEKKTSFNGKGLIIRGTLLYSDGKTLLQVDKNDNPVVSIGKEVVVASQPKEMGTQTIRGEIIDPKCFFGVMKPGEGKVHKDCAIRCILGGIPPVLKVMNEKGENNYFLLVGQDGEKMNEAVQDFVAEPVAVTARLVQLDDWMVLFVNKDNGINRIAAAALARPDLVLASCTTNCMK